MAVSKSPPLRGRNQRGLGPEDPSGGGRSPRPDTRAAWGWCLYDWANSAFPTVVQTFVISAFFTQAVAETPERGTAQWGWAMAAAGLAIACVSPFLGAMADRSGRRTRWVAAFTAGMCLATGLLWFVRPEPGLAALCLVLVAVGTVCFEIATVFYNALLPALAAPGRIGRLSGWAWGLGYLGGLLCLVAVLFGLIKASPPPFGLDPADAEPVRASAVLVAGWIAVFSLPFLAWVKDPKGSGGSLAAAARDALPNLVRAVKRWPPATRVGRFLLARMLYTDGLNTLFAFGGVYAAGTFGMPLADVITFGIALNVTAGIGAAVSGWLDDALGPKTVVLGAVAAIAAIGLALVLTESVTTFWVLGLLLGLFLGPAQAASRTFMARIAPPGDVNACFGLYALSGKVTAFLGPALLATVTSATNSQRAGMATILVFLAAGGLLLATVPRPGKD